MKQMIVLFMKMVQKTHNVQNTRNLQLKLKNGADNSRAEKQKQTKQKKQI